MTVRRDDAQDEAATAIYQEIARQLEEAQQDGVANRLAILERCANAYAAATFGVRKN
jgi:hypothetical protein